MNKVERQAAALERDAAVGTNLKALGFWRTT
jgi:hypothetical protein